MELYKQIRQEYEHGAGTIREVARRVGVHRREVRRALASAVPPERKKPERERPKLAPVQPFIDTILEADRRASRKQRHTAHRIWMRLRQEKPELVVAESTLREYVRQRKASMGLLGHEVFVPQSYQYGGEAQVDWFEIWAEFDGLPRKVYIFCMRSMASGAAFHPGLSARHTAGVSRSPRVGVRVQAAVASLPGCIVVIGARSQTCRGKVSRYRFCFEPASSSVLTSAARAASSPNSYLEP